MLTVPRLKAGLFLAHLIPLLIAFQCGWLPGFLAMACVHLTILTITLWPGPTPFCPARQKFGAFERSLVLTIDDGPCPDTPAFLNLLERYNAKAVFFVIGERAAARPDLVQEMVAGGHAVENHTMTHPAKTFWAYTPDAQYREITLTNGIVEEITGTKPTWFRAPAGFRNPFTGAILKEVGLNYLGWSTRSFDTWNTNAAKLLKRLRKGFQPGAVLLIHQGHPHSTALLELLLKTLANDGWKVMLPPQVEKLTWEESAAPVESKSQDHQP